MNVYEELVGKTISTVSASGPHDADDVITITFTDGSLLILESGAYDYGDKSYLDVRFVV